MVRLTDIVEKVRAYQPQADFGLLHRAFTFAAEKHEGQKRKSGEPYITHPTAVADIIADMRLDVASVSAAFLHDVVEDCGVTDADMKQRFGEEISFLVDGVTKLGKIHFSSKEDQQAESFRKMVVAMARDIRVLVVKLADRLDNMRTLEHMKPEAQVRIAQETLDIYAPLAGRLGINWLKSELEDLSFSYLWPEQYADVVQKTKKVARDRDRYILDVVKRLQKMLIERGFAADVSGRAKHLYSIFRKMRQSNCDFEQVHDVLAFRVLVEDVADCYAALGVIHSQWTPIPGRFKDYVALPKPNMYQSLHTTVIGPGQRRIEVQIRTHEMHKTAENGIAAHWTYKEKTGGLDVKDAARFAWLRQLMEFQQEVTDPAEFLDSVKVDLFAEEVYVFTPKGQLRVFPRGATPIDFAYAVHSEVGDHCAGARVNGAIVPLRYQLHNGDTIEILTSPQQHPSKDWLDFVATGRARSKIRTYIRGEERKRSVQVGKNLIERAFHKHDASFARLVKSGQLETIAQELRVANAEELYAAVGIGKIEASDVYATAVQDEKQAADLRPSLFERTVKRVSEVVGTSSGGIRVDDSDDVVVRFGQCCSPLPGDPITGWITRGRGVTVHRRGCAKAMELDPERRIDVSWSERSKVARPVTLRVTTTDKPGILANVSAAFTEAGVNIREANCRVGRDGTAVNLFHFNVEEAAKLQHLMRKIQGVDGVYSVERASTGTEAAS